jgi:DNA helicase-2/ATP-dependent DNA helicase PcrA
MEEERRLCYVAITRAKERLILTSAHNRMIFGRTTANRVSRFVFEIPEEHIRKSIPRNYSFQERTREEGFFAPRPQRTYGVPWKTPAARPAAAPAPAEKKPPVSYAVGDRVSHKAFGLGEIIKMTPMGGDFLVEIRFDTAGGKKLMLRAAAQHMEKV